MEKLDTPDRGEYIRQTIQDKFSLKRFYKDIYCEYIKCLNQCPEDGIALEIGSGVGFAKSIVSELFSSDILLYDGLDIVIDGTNLPFINQSLRMICMMNVFHHISDVRPFFKEAERCLIPGGRILIADQHVGLLSRIILKFFHHEPFHPNAKDWEFSTKGPLTGANGALTWIVFVRDKMTFEKLYPKLSIVRYQTHSPLQYWLTGGLKKWNLLPRCLLNIVKWIDACLIRLSPDFGSFVFVEIVKNQCIQHQ